MHISCPHCNAAYEVGPMIKNAVLVCHRCHAEFSMDDDLVEQQKKSEPKEVDQSLPLFDQIRSRRLATRNRQKQKHVSEESDTTSKQSSKEVNESPIPAFLNGIHEYAEKIKLEKASTKPDATDTPEGKSSPKKTDQGNNSGIEEVQISLETLKESGEGELSETTSHKAAKISDDKNPFPPARESVVIWPWLIAILLIISAAGFWFKQDVWLDHPWVRSVLINMHLPVEVRNKDWSVIPGSVQGNWLKRDDGSQILTIQGRIENRLYCELPPPQILVRFFDDTGITESLGEKLLPITEPPSMEQVKHAPFVMPDVDRVPVEAQGARGFFLVLDSLPEHTADFTLSPVVK